MRQLYRSRNKEAFEQLLKLRCPHLSHNIVALDSPSRVEEIFLEWLFVDQVDEEKFPFQMDEAHGLFGEALIWAKQNHVEGLMNWLLNLVTRYLNHDNYSQFLQYSSQSMVLHERWDITIFGSQKSNLPN